MTTVCPNTEHHTLKLYPSENLKFQTENPYREAMFWRTTGPYTNLNNFLSNVLSQYNN